MRLELGCCALLTIAVSGCASMNDDEPVVASNKGMVTVAGISPAQALGAIDTSQLVAGPPVGTTDAAVEASGKADLPEGQNAINIEGVAPSRVLGAIDTTKLVTPQASSRTKTASKQ